MPYVPYADKEYYNDRYHGSVIPADSVESALLQASRHIDTLTYNRIVGQGFSRLTDFQQEIVREVCCAQADFEYENRSIFNMILSGYAINGISMQFGESWNVTTQKGIPMRKDIYEQLCQTGLCCRLLR